MSSWTAQPIQDPGCGSQNARLAAGLWVNKSASLQAVLLTLSIDLGSSLGGLGVGAVPRVKIAAERVSGVY